MTAIMKIYDVVLIGGGPANLMAASFLIKQGLKIALFEQNSQLGKKFLVAGKSGLNLSMDYTYSKFIEGYYRDKDFIHSTLKGFTHQDQRLFFKDVLGLETFVGSAGKVFPKETAVNVLKIWLTYLRNHGLEIYTHHQWQSGESNNHHILNLKTKQLIDISCKYTVFGFGGNSWRETGSNSNWKAEFEKMDIQINPFKPSNSGLICNLDPFVYDKWNGHFIKNCTVSYQNKQFTGEIRIGKHQIEGSPIYHLNQAIRQDLEFGPVFIYLDFKPQWTQEQIESKWKVKHSISKNSKALKLSPIFPSLIKSLKENTSPHKYIKSFPIEVLKFEEVDKAISTIGGIDLDELNADLTLKKQLNWFVNGEMIDWDAPTGGYLLSACFALGKKIGKQIEQQFKRIE